MAQSRGQPAARQGFRVAIYCRQSVADDKEFGSIQAQREAVEAYVASQKHEGWELIPDHFEDHGFSGSNTDRPAFQRLLELIVAGQVDMVAVYKIDRLSRSLADFTQIMRVFETHGVGFVSITQSFDTSNSMGKLMLNVLMSFAEFEREQIGERTKDKMGATRKRGAWTGGVPMLGYDVVDKKLVVNQSEAEQVRGIFDVFVDAGAIGPVVRDVNARGWRTKVRGERGGNPFDKPTVRRILRSRIYAGEVEYEGEVHDGEHEAIVDPRTWERAQRILDSTASGRRGPASRRASVLGGLLRCGACGEAYVHTYTKKGSKRYRYYACQTLLKQGGEACPGSRLPAQEIENDVVEQIRAIGRDPSVVADTLAEARDVANTGIPKLEGRLAALKTDCARLTRERTNVVDSIAGGGTNDVLVERLQSTERELRIVCDRIAETESEIRALQGRVIDEDDLSRALAQFDPVWEALTTEEKARLLSLLVERVTYNAQTEELSIELRPEGVRCLGGRERKTA